MATTVAAVFPWRAEYSVGIAEIDAQHKQLINGINELHAAMLRGEGKEALTRILDALVRYTETHFAFEENMLRIRGYSELAAHQLEHHKLKKEVLDLRQRYAAGKVTITMEVMHFLKGWLSNHILGTDMRYARDRAR